jgi:hypothetical protein
MKINEQELKILQRLDGLVNGQAVNALIDPIVARVERQLSQNPDALLAWEPIPLSIYGESLPEGIRSSWIFILRAQKTTGAERHPNSIQRMMSYRGTGDLQVWSGDQWVSNPLVSDNNADLSRRWVAVPINTWHQPVVGDENWVVVSYSACRRAYRRAPRSGRREDDAAAKISGEARVSEVSFRTTPTRTSRVGELTSSRNQKEKSPTDRRTQP